MCLCPKKIKMSQRINRICSKGRPAKGQIAIRGETRVVQNYRERVRSGGVGGSGEEEEGVREERMLISVQCS